MAKYSENVKNIVLARLKALPPEVCISVGDNGEFTRDMLVSEVEKDSAIGEEMILLQVEFIRHMNKILQSQS